MISEKLLNTIERILKNVPDELLDLPDWCFVRKDKAPMRHTFDLAETTRPNHFKDFGFLVSSLDKIKTPGSVEGMGLRVANVCAIDIDKCISEYEKMDNHQGKITQITPLAQKILETFNEYGAYIEVSFSKTGLRILFYSDIDEFDLNKYYIKNSNNGIEFYCPCQQSPRYMTITGRTNQLSIKRISHISKDKIYEFLDEYMVRPDDGPKEKRVSKLNLEGIEHTEAVRLLLKGDFSFQDDWFDPATGFGTGESERDFRIIQRLFDNITEDEDEIIQIFETSPFYKSKDSAHIDKWTKKDNIYCREIVRKLLRQKGE